MASPSCTEAGSSLWTQRMWVAPDALCSTILIAPEDALSPTFGQVMVVLISPLAHLVTVMFCAPGLQDFRRRAFSIKTSVGRWSCMVVRGERTGWADGSKKRGVLCMCGPKQAFIDLGHAVVWPLWLRPVAFLLAVRPLARSLAPDVPGRGLGRPDSCHRASSLFAQTAAWVCWQWVMLLLFARVIAEPPPHWVQSRSAHQSASKGGWARHSTPSSPTNEPPFL